MADREIQRIESAICAQVASETFLIDVRTIEAVSNALAAGHTDMPVLPEPVPTESSGHK